MPEGRRETSARIEEKKARRDERKEGTRGRKREAAPRDERGLLCASAGDATYARAIGCVMISFQLTRPRETQCPSCVRRNARRRFNSRVRKGRDCAAQRRVYNSAFPIFCAAFSFARGRVFCGRAFTRTSSANPSRAPGVRPLRRTCASSVPRLRRRGRGARLL